MKRALRILLAIVALWAIFTLLSTYARSQTLDARTSILTLPYNGLRILPHAGTGCPSAGSWVIYSFAVGTDGAICYCTVSGSPGTWVGIASVQTGDIDMNGSDVFDVGAGGYSVETMGTNLDGIATDVNDIIATPQCNPGPFVLADGSNNDLAVSYGQLNTTDVQVYQVVTSNSDDDDLEVGARFCVPAFASAFDATSAVTLVYKLSDGADGNGVKLRVRGTDGTICYTSSAGVETAKTTLTATASDLSTCVKTPGAALFISAFIDTLDSGDTVSIGLITLKME